MAENKVEIKVTADTAQAVAGLSSVEKGLKGTGSSAIDLGNNSAGAGKGLAQIGQGSEGAAAGLAKTSKGAQGVGEQLAVAKTQIAAFIGAQLGLSTVKSVATTADEYSNLQARIKLATGEGKNFTDAFEKVKAIAIGTNSNLVQTGTLFTRVAEAGKSAGLSTEAAIAQSLRLTETIQQAVQLSGGSAESSNAAVTQLIQGLQSGVLRGEEFNSMMEQAPRLAKALSDGLGVTTGALRKMSETGQLTADTVINALKGQADTLKSEFATLPPTLGRAIENLSTSWTLYIGEADKATGASAAAASAIKFLSDNLSTVGGYLLDAGQAAAGLAAVKLAQSFFGAATAATQAGVAIVASTAATTVNTVAHQANAAAAAREALAFKTLAADVAAQAAALGGNTAATVANSAAKNASGAAANVASEGVGRFAGLLSGLKLFSLIGIVTNFKDIGTAIGEGAAKLMGYKDRTQELAQAEKVAAAIAADALALRERGQALYKAEIDKQFALSDAAKTSVAEFEKLTKEGATASEAISKIGKDFDLASVPGIKNATAVLDKLAADGKLSAEQFQTAWTNALKGADLGVFEVQARAALAGTAREAERLAQVLDATLREAIKRTGLDFDVISGGMGKAARSAINDTQAIVSSLDGLKKQGIDTGAVLTASIGKSINTADSQAAIAAVKVQIESLRTVLGNKMADGLLDQATAKALDLGAALDKAKPGINSLREAMAELGLKSRDELQATANKATDAFGVITKAGQQEGESYVGWQARKTEAARLMLERLIAANNGIATEAIKARAAMQGLDISVDAAGKSTVRAMNEGSQAVDRLTGAAGGAANAVGGIGQAAQMSTAQLEALASAQDKVNSKHGQGKADRAGKYDGPEFKSVTGNTREERFAGQAATDGTGAFSLRQKQRNGTLSADDLKTAEAVLEAAKFNKQMYEQYPAAFGLTGGQNIIQEYNSARILLDEVQAKIRTTAGLNTPANQQNNPFAQPRPAATQVSNQTFTVKFDLGNGRTQNVNVASANDAQTLIAALQQAKSAAGF